MTGYEYLAGVIGQVRPGGHVQATARARDAITDWVTGALRGIADGSRPVRAVRHPLGFTCLPVERSGSCGVCVHLWSPQVGRAAPTTSPVHAHCWELTSHVLFGQLANFLMVVTEAEAPRPGEQLPGGGGGPGGLDAPYEDRAQALYRVLEVRSEGDVDDLVPTLRHVRCLPGQPQVVTIGNVYSIPAGVFHATWVPPDAQVATVVLGRLVPGVPDWSLGAPNSDRHLVRRRGCDAEETADVVRIVLGCLLAATTGPAFPA
jgi:hypothetical protein